MGSIWENDTDLIIKKIQHDIGPKKIFEYEKKSMDWTNAETLDNSSKSGDKSKLCVY